MNVFVEKPKIDRFADVINSIDENTDLARPALLLAADEYPSLNVERYMRQLDDLADEALQTVMADAESECEAARRLALFLANTKGFQGNECSYYDPKNSFLNEVLDRRIGIPISLSLVLIEVGRRLGLPLVGIGFPGHFLVGCGARARRGKQYLLLDPFSGGKAVDWSECEQRLQAMGIEFDPVAHLSPVSNRQFFARILNNLKRVYIDQRDIDRSLRTIGRLSLLDDCFIDEYRQFGALLAGEGLWDGARQSLRAYLDLRPEGSGAESAR